MDGTKTTMTMGKVAFGSGAYDVFLKLEEERGDKPVDVYIYESVRKAGRTTFAFRGTGVTWDTRALSMGHTLTA